MQLLALGYVRITLLYMIALCMALVTYYKSSPAVPFKKDVPVVKSRVPSKAARHIQNKVKSSLTGMSCFVLDFFLCNLQPSMILLILCSVKGS